MSLRVEAVEYNTQDIADVIGKETVVEFMVGMNKLNDSEKQMAFIVFLIDEIASMSGGDISQKMIMHLNIFVTALHQAPDGISKTEFTEDAIKSIRMIGNNNAGEISN